MIDYIKKIEKSKKTMVEVYMELQQEYSAKFGEKTIVLYQNGQFYEIYQTLEIGKAKEVTELLNLYLSRKDKSIDEISLKNPYMGGFPTDSSERHIDILLDNDWTIVLVEQISSPPNPDRAITKILSKNTFIDTIKGTNIDNYILSLFFIVEKNGKIYCGWSVIDVFIGKIYVDEIFSNPIEEIRKIILFFRPNEIIINITSHQSEFSSTGYISDMCDQLGLFNKKIIHRKDSNDLFNNVQYQNKFLSEKFNTKSMLSTIELLNLEMKESGRKSLVSLLKYCEEYNPNICNSLQIPKPFDNNDYVRLENNAIEQLEIFTTKRNDLFHIIDKTSTQIGKRFLLFNLLHPICNQEILEKRYTTIEKFIQDKNYQQIENHLDKINDLEKLNRKWCIGRLHPCELLNYFLSIDEIIKCKEFLDKKDIYPSETINMISELKNDIEKEFVLENLKKSMLKNIYLNIFKDDTVIEKLHEKKKNYYLIMNEFCDSINLKCGEDAFKLESTDSNMFYLKTTNKKWENYEKKIGKNNTEIKGYMFEGKDFKKDHSMKSYSKITHTLLTSISFCIENVKSEINRVSNEKYLDIILKMHQTYKVLLDEIIDFVQNIDYFKSLAKIADIYHHSKPVIKKSENSFIRVEEIRHPIIERLNNRIFIPNDVEIGNGNNILLYGCNSSGKSVLLKSLGLCLILAQIGSFVPCKNMVLSPFKKIFTRILTSDNIYQGHSSFMTEMIELKRILDNSDKHTISFCDELTHGTESSSGTSIMIATILELVEKSNFFFTSHLHNVYEHPLIKNIMEKNKLAILHMSVEYDKEKDCIVYDRKLKQGGGNKLYGVEFLKALHFDKFFLEKCLEIRDNDEKVSKYNKEVIVDKCSVCGDEKDLHTHHIQEQHTADENGMIGNIHKNNKENLVVLCEKCHELTHKNEIKIQGYKDTNLGKELLFEVNQQTSPKELVLMMKNEKKSQKKIKEELEKIGIKISIKKIAEIIKQA